jgi:hypothetical protein
MLDDRAEKGFHSEDDLDERYPILPPGVNPFREPHAPRPQDVRNHHAPSRRWIERSVAR